MTTPNDDAFLAFSERLFDQNKFAIKLGLENITTALTRENLQTGTERRILVGGTNGKGQTSAFLSQILTAHGLRVGFYSSPHLVDVTERFRIDGRAVSRETVLDVGRDVLKSYGEGGDPALTFFEMTTLMAARIFRDAEVDVAIYEVGLGGRLDAVNALERELVVITNIGFDHQQYLGETLDQIVDEKVALATVQTVVGPQTYTWARTFDQEVVWVHDTGSTVGNNAATAQRAAACLIDPEPSVVADALANTRWPGRFDEREVTIDGHSNRLVFDAAHNVDGISAFVAFVQTLEERPTRILFGAMRDKNVAEMLGLLSGLRIPIEGVGIATDRALSVSELEAFDAIERAWPSIREVAGPLDRTAIIGSIFLLGETFSYLGLDAGSIHRDGG